MATASRYCAVICSVLAVIFSNSTAYATTQQELLPKIYEALGVTAPAKYFTPMDGELTKADAFRAALEGMGWGFELKMYDQVFMLPEWSDRDPLQSLAVCMKPQPPASICEHLDEPFTDEDLPAFWNWLHTCKKEVSLHSQFNWQGVSLIIIKHGIGTPGGPANGTKDGVNQPRYIAALAVDMNLAPCQIATAEMIGLKKKATLASICTENYGVIGGINGGYFGGSQPIGILRRQGYAHNPKFWPNRSAFGWNDKGEYIFIDAKEVKNIDSRFDKYTEMMQAGPLLLKNGKFADNTENIAPGVLNNRHPRTIVGTDGKHRIVWAVIDGRNAMHSVGATIEETKTVCRWLGLTTALNLDGGGSSSLWWRGFTFTLPSNSKADERPIPYAVLVFQQGSGVRQ